MQEIRETDLVSYLPPFLAEYPQLRATLKAEDPEFRLIWQAAQRVFANKFIETADEYGISRFERLLGIYPESGASLESRRARVFAWWWMPLPYTWRKLLEKLDSVCGKDNFIARKYLEEYRIKVEVILENISEVREVIHAMLPANMSYVLASDYGIEVWNTEYIRFAVLRLHYKFFGWQNHEFREFLAFRWTVCELNDMSLLPLRLCLKIYVQSKVVAERLRLHMPVMFWGSDGLLDGSCLLDGSRLLDACRRYGVRIGTRFGGLGVHQESSTALRNLVIWWRQENPLASSRARITQRFSVAFFGVPSLPDGSVLLDVGLRYDLRPALKVALKVEMPTQRIGGTVETKTDDYCFLDGSVPLDGSRCLNSVYRKESLE